MKVAPMITVLNYSGHELAPSVEEALAERLGNRLDVRELSRNLDLTEVAGEARRMVADADISPSTWGAAPPVVMLPTLGIAAAAVLAALHGASGYFPRVAWLRRNPASGAFDIVEVLDLATIRESARAERWSH